MASYLKNGHRSSLWLVIRSRPRTTFSAILDSSCWRISFQARGCLHVSHPCISRILFSTSSFPSSVTVDTVSDDSGIHYEHRCDGPCRVPIFPGKRTDFFQRTALVPHYTPDRYRTRIFRRTFSRTKNGSSFCRANLRRGNESNS